MIRQCNVFDTNWPLKNFLSQGMELTLDFDIATIATD